MKRNAIILSLLALVSFTTMLQASHVALASRQQQIVGSEAAQLTVANETGEPDQVREEFNQTYPLAADGRISLTNIAGAIKIVGWERNEVRVEAVKTAYSPEKLAEARIEVEATSNTLRIQTRYPDRNNNYFGDNDYRKKESAASVAYTLSVPRTALLNNIQSVSGNVRLENLVGAVTAASVSGAVTARKMNGALKLSSVSGAVETTLESGYAAESISLNSVSGRVEITLPSQANATVRASTVSGNINNDFDLPVSRGDYVGRDLLGRLGTGATRIRLNSVSGAVAIRRANDGQSLGAVTNNLIGRDAEADDYADARREAQEGLREAEKELAAARAELEKSQHANADTRREAQEFLSEAQRAVQDAQRELRELERERERSDRDARREREREVMQAQREREREVMQAQREGEREVARAQREAARAQRQTSNYGDYGPRLIAREERVFQVTEAPNIRLQTGDGAIRVQSWDAPQIKVIFIKQAREQSILESYRIIAEQNGANFDFRAKLPDDAQNWHGGGSVELEVYVPHQVKSLSANTGDGRISVGGVTGELSFNTGDGAMEIAECGGRLTANTSDGRIEVSDFNGAARLNSGDGRITLNGKFTELNANTGDGVITFNYPADLNAVIETTGGHVVTNGTVQSEEISARSRRRVTIGRGGPVFKLQTGDGRIVLQPQK